jgi:hypothetical protein
VVATPTPDVISPDNAPAAAVIYRRADYPSPNVGRRGKGRTPGVSGVVSQSQVGAAVCKVPGAIGVGRVVADGTDEDGARAAKMDEWVVWETVERAAPRGEG